MLCGHKDAQEVSRHKYTVLFIPNKHDRNLLKETIPQLGMTYYEIQVTEDVLRDLFKEHDPLYKEPAEDKPEVIATEEPKTTQPPSPGGCIVMILIAMGIIVYMALTHKLH